ncbi:hypothetical protein HK097_008204 [Rhizophlyctis rosea]|uniref:GPI inositol-deacylase n=1 Tax=Rhizophlyctis rosea TaxID=64517 RepID=A0AAD5SK28_9FUNG|nr:hypothetical protein HK097_008204 [Rhizophlyctis rosea]
MQAAISSPHTRNVLLLFVHGFLGTENSFATFPPDLTAHIRQLPQFASLNVKLEARVLPRFDTKGDPTTAVEALAAWLMLNGVPGRLSSDDRGMADVAASTQGIDAVVIVGHSMGGILAVEAYRRLKKVEEEVKDGKKSAGHSDETVRQKYEQPTSAHHTPLPNIVAIVTIDSPFYGLNPRVYTAAATTRAAAIISDYVPPLPVLPTIHPPSLPSIPIAETITSVVQAGTSAAQAVGTGLHVVGETVKNSSYAVGASATAAARAIPLAVSSLPGAAVQAISTGREVVTNMPSNVQTGLQAGVQAVGFIPEVASHAARTALEMGTTAVSSLPSLRLWPGAATGTGVDSETGVKDQSTIKDAGVKPEVDTEAALEAALATVAAEAAVMDGRETLKVAEPHVMDVEQTTSDADSESLVPGIWPVPIPTDGAQDEAVLFAAAIGAAAAAVEGSATDSNSPTATPPIKAGQIDPLAATTTTASSVVSPMSYLHLPKDANWTTWVTLGLAGAGLAAGVYYSGGAALATGPGVMVRRVATAYALSHVEEGRKYLQFLWPLWGEGMTGMGNRIDEISRDVGEGKLRFRCFYVELPPLPAEEATKKRKERDVEPKIAELNSAKQEKGLFTKKKLVEEREQKEKIVREAEKVKEEVEKEAGGRVQERLRKVVGVERKHEGDQTQHETRDRTMEMYHEMDQQMGWEDVRKEEGDGMDEDGKPPPLPPRIEPKSAVATALAETLVGRRPIPPVPTEASTDASATQPQQSAPATRFTAAFTSLTTALSSLRSTSTAPAPPPPPPPAPTDTQIPVPDPKTPRTFITLPPHRHAHLFKKVESDGTDEIMAHVKVFERGVNGGYWGVVNVVAGEVVSGLKVWGGRRVWEEGMGRV